MHERHPDANLLTVAVLKQWQKADRAAATMQKATNQVAQATRDTEWRAACKKARNEGDCTPKKPKHPPKPNGGVLATSSAFIATTASTAASATATTATSTILTETLSEKQ